MISFITSLLFSHYAILIGYALCVVFPIPWLNAAIIAVWAKFGSKIMGMISSVETTAETAAVNEVKTVTAAVIPATLSTAATPVLITTLAPIGTQPVAATVTPITPAP